jgi:cytochrome c553
MRRCFCGLVLAIAAMFCPRVAHAEGAGDASRGRQLVVKVCGACHGVDGNSTSSSIPKLAGQYPEYLSKQLHAFRPVDGAKPHRENATMTPIAEILKERDISDVVAYFSRLPSSPDHSRQEARLAFGKKIYMDGNPNTGLPACVSCHRPNGEGIQPEFPRLAGQKADYVEAQLNTWAAARGGKGHLMTLIVSFLRAPEISAVADYVAQLKPNPK